MRPFALPRIKSSGFKKMEDLSYQSLRFITCIKEQGRSGILKNASFNFCDLW